MTVAFFIVLLFEILPILGFFNQSLRTTGSGSTKADVQKGIKTALLLLCFLGHQVRLNNCSCVFCLGPALKKEMFCAPINLPIP